MALNVPKGGFQQGMDSCVGFDVDPIGVLDTMVLHNIAFPEYKHDLGFVTSVWGRPSRAWKTDREGRKSALEAETDEELHRYCLHGKTYVRLADGTSRTIRDIVSNRVAGPVLTMDAAGAVAVGRIVAWHRRRVPGQAWVKLVLGMQVLRCTPDHGIWTTRGRIEAAQVRAGDRVYTVEGDGAHQRIVDVLVVSVKPHTPATSPPEEQELAETRYCITVETHGRFFTSGGLVSNCGYDVSNTDSLVEPLLDLIYEREQQHIIPLAHTVQRICGEMHANGMWVDQAKRKEVERLCIQKLSHGYKVKNKKTGEIEWVPGYLQQLRQLSGKADLNPGSTAQLRTVLFEEGWRLEPPFSEDDEEMAYTESGDRSTSDVVIRALLKLEITGQLQPHQALFLKVLRTYRSEQKMLGTYIAKLRSADEVVDVGWDDDDDEDERAYREEKNLSKRGVVWPDGRMRPGYNCHVALTGRLSSSKPINCFDGETEILTEQGWIRFDRLPRGLRVAQWLGGRQGQIDFVVPTAYHQGRHTGDLVYYQNQSSDLLMTPNHRIPLIRSQNTDQERDITGTDLLSLGAGWSTLHAGMGTGGRGLGLVDDAIRLMVAIQADGSVFKRADGTQSVDFGFKKERKAGRLNWLLQRLSIPFVWIDAEDISRYRCVIDARTSDSLTRALALLGPNKVWGSWLLEMTPEQRSVFCAELWEWDGCTTVKSQYASVHKENADWVQIMLCLSGIRANVRYYKNNVGGHAWIVDVRRTTTNAITTRAERGIQPWDDDVFCVTVPSDAIVVRRRGKVTITRQSQNVPKSLRTLIRAGPGHILIGADADQIEFRIGAAWWGVTKYLKAFEAGADPHSTTALACFGEDFLKADGFPGGHWDEGLFFPNGEGDWTASAYDQRTLGKRIQFNGQYKGSPETMCRVIQEGENDAGELIYLGMTEDWVRYLYQNWKAGIPEMERGWNRDIAFFRKHKYIADPVVGRRRYCPNGENPNEIVNFPIQGAAAALVNRAMIRLAKLIPFEKWGPGTGLIGQVHDWLGLEVPDTGVTVEEKLNKKGKKVFVYHVSPRTPAAEAMEAMNEVMNFTEPSLPGVRFTSAAKIGYTWKEVG